MIYWFPLCALIGNLPVSSVYSLMICIVCMCSSLELVDGRGTSYGDVSGIGLRGIFRLVERTPCLDWNMCPFIVSSSDGQYAVVLARVSPGQVR